MATIEESEFKTSLELERLEYLLYWKDTEGNSMQNVNLQVSPPWIYWKGSKQFSKNGPPIGEYLTLESRHYFEFFNKSSLPDLKLLEQDLEEKLKSPEYSIRRSPSIQKEVDKWRKEGKLKEVRRFADHQIISGPVFIEGMRFANKLSGGQLPKCFIVDLANGSLAFIANTEEEVIERFKVLVPKKTFKTPTKVLAKMVLLRIRLLHEEIVRHNTWIVQRNSNPIPSVNLLDLVEWRELSSIEAIQSYLKYTRTCSNGNLVLDTVKEMKMVLAKDLINDQVVKEAWEMFLVEQVMSQ